MATAGGLEIHSELHHKAGAPAAAPASVAAEAVPAAPARVEVVPLERPRKTAAESKRAAIPLIAFAIVALLVAGVASALVRVSARSTPLAMVQASATTTQDAGTARVSATVKSASGPLANGVTLDGGFDFDSHRAALEIDPAKFGLTGVGKIEAIADYSNGIVMYMKFPSQFASEMGGKPWVKIDVNSLLKQAGVDVDIASLAQGQSNDPTQGLSMVRGADSVIKVGPEQVRGEDTTHYKIIVNLDKAIAEAPADERDTLNKVAAIYTVRTFPVDLWLDSEGRVHRFQQTIDPNNIRLPAALQANSPFVGPTTVTYDLYDFGAAIDAKIPPADQVTDFNTLLQQGR